jgi:hypothetical protein
MTARRVGEVSHSSHMEGPYADHFLDARDVCNNCFRHVRVERVDPVMARDGLRHALDAHYSRKRKTTTREYHDSDPNVTHAEATFCHCGVEGTFERLWSPTDISRDRFKTLLKRALRTLEQKGIQLSRERKRETLAYALQTFDRDGDADQAIAQGIEMGIVAQASADERDNTQHSP